MKLKALKSFIGKVSMNVDEIKEVTNEKLAKELIKAGNAIEIKDQKEEQKQERKEEPKINPAKKSRRKK